MPVPTTQPAPLTAYKILSFDVYGSLIEYKQHILAAFQPLLSRLPPDSPYRNTTPLSLTVPDSADKGSITFLRLFQKLEDAIKLEKPVKRFDEIMAEIWRRVAAELGVETSEEEARGFGSEGIISSWPCFDGTVEALRVLGRYYRLVALSNIDRFAWGITSRSPASGLGEVEWWKVFTAEDFGEDSSRADDAKLETLLAFCEQQGFGKGEVLHVAQSLGHDHAPAKRAGLGSVWLIGDGPRWGKEEESRKVLEGKVVGYGWKARNLREFAAVVEREWEAKV